MFWIVRTWGAACCAPTHLCVIIFQLRKNKNGVAVKDRDAVLIFI
jgi:hypothetical protein